MATGTDEEAAPRRGRYVLLALAVTLVGGYAIADMVMARRLLIAGGGGSFTVPEPTLYALYNGQNGDAVYAIGAATNTSGAGWVRYASNPVFQKTGAGWESHHVKDPMLLWDGTQYVMYYSGYDGTNYRIGRATFPSWPPTSITRYGSNPIITLGSGGSWNDNRVTFPTVLYEPTDTGREWKMWVIGNNESIGYYYSSNGLSFTAYAGNPVATFSGTVGAWDRYAIGLGTVIKVGSTYNMFISGRRGTTNPQWQGGLITFTNPEGTYTADAGNPLFRARFNDSPSASVSMTADTLSGSAVVTVTNTSWATVGEPVVIVDGNGIAEVETRHVQSIDSGTQITMNGAVTANFEGTGGVLRSFLFNAVVPRTIRAVSGGYEAFGTPFQPVEDLTVPTKLREGAFRWTATNLDDVWAPDYSTGLLFPLYPANTGWDKYSAENPSVIEAP